MWATCSLSASSGYHAESHEGCYQKQTSSSDFSVYHADFHEGHGTVGEGRVVARHVIINAAWERHGVYELALRLPDFKAIGTRRW
jgi:hypothetical protein